MPPKRARQTSRPSTPVAAVSVQAPVPAPAPEPVVLRFNNLGDADLVTREMWETLRNDMAFTMGCFITTSSIPATFKALAADDALKALTLREYGHIPEMLEVVQSIDDCHAGFIEHLAGLNALIADNNAAMCTSMDRCFYGTPEESRARLLGGYMQPMIHMLKRFDERMETMAKKIAAVILAKTGKGDARLDGLIEFARLVATRPEPALKMEVGVKPEPAVKTDGAAAAM